MKKIGLLAIALIATTCVIIFSCGKTVKIPISYTVVTNHKDALEDVFIPDSGQFNWQVMAKFLTGYAQDAVTLKISGLPADVSVTPDSFSAVPTYVVDFVFSTNHAARNTYPITITGYAPGEKPQSYTVNLTVIPADCATTLLGNLNGHNACAVTGSTDHIAIATSTSQNTLNIKNFGGYGSATNTNVLLNCNKDSLTIPSQNIGNGVVLQGKGTFTGSGMTIWFSATGTAVGADNCTVTYTK